MYCLFPFMFEQQTKCYKNEKKSSPQKENKQTNKNNIKIDNKQK